MIASRPGIVPALGLRAAGEGGFFYRRPLSLEKGSVMFLSSLLRTPRTPWARTGRPARPQTPRRRGRRLTVEQLEDRTVPSVVLGVSVDGMNPTNNSCDCEPPDTIAAAGPNHVIEMVNLAIEVFNKDGTVASPPQSLATFYSSVFKGPNQSDPFVMYDELAGHFVTGVLDYVTNLHYISYLDFAVSGTDGTGALTWTFERYDVSEGRFFADYPRAGWNADAYFVGFDMFKALPSDHEQVITIPKNNLGGTPLSHDFHYRSVFTHSTVTPAVMHGAITGGPEYFLEASPAGGSSIDIVTDTNVLSSPAFTSTTVNVTPFVPGGFPQQPSGTIDAAGTQIFNAAFRVVNGVGHLVAAQQGGENGASTPVHAIWYDFIVSTSDNTTTATMANQEFIPAATPTTSTFMPSVDINAAGSIGLNYNESSSTEYWSMYVTERAASDPANTMEAPVLAVAGTANTSDTRSGDYSGITVDPSDGLTFWDTHVASFHLKTELVASPVIAAMLPNSGPSLAEKRTVMPSQTASVLGDKGMVSQVITSPAGSQPWPQIGIAVRVSSTHSLGEFWADWVSQDFLALQW
jgi:hypothetical protein